MKKSIVEVLREQFGVTKTQARMLISMNARKNNGKVNVNQIKDDVRMIVDSMIMMASHKPSEQDIENVQEIAGSNTSMSTYIPTNYDIAHELWDCGKDRTYDAMRFLMRSREEFDILESYLPNYYSDNVDLWRSTFCKAVQEKLYSIMEMGIDEYRKFVDKLPDHNIGIIADTFCMEPQIAKFLATKATPKEFQKFICDEGTDKKKYGLPREACDRILTQVQIADDCGELKRFMRGRITEVFSMIYRDETLTNEQKKELQNMWLSNHLAEKTNHDFLKILKFKQNGKYNILKKSLEYYDPEILEFYEMNLEPMVKGNVQRFYEELVESLRKEMRDGIITAEKLKQMYRNSALKNYLMSSFADKLDIRFDEKRKRYFLDYTKGMEFISGIVQNSGEIDATELVEIINMANENSQNIVRDRMKEIVEKGMKQIVLTGDREFTLNDTNFELTGLDSLETDSEELGVEVPYEYIDIGTNGIRYLSKKLKMTDSEKQRFNEINEENVRRDKFGQIIEMRINDAEYEIQSKMNSNNGYETYIRRTSDGACISLNKTGTIWGGARRALQVKDLEIFVSIALHNPERFTKVFNDENSRFVYGHSSIGVLDFLENVFREEKEPEFEDTIMELAQQREDLQKKKEAAQNLVKEYTDANRMTDLNTLGGGN